METRLLNPDELPLVAPVVEGYFGNAMPVVEGKAAFYAALDGGRLAGFVHVEQLLHFNCVYVEPDYRGAALARALMGLAVARIPFGHSGVWLTERPNAGRLARSLGAREVGTYRVYRKDIR
jgi:GNAT superfamily N-acetyltransferase